MDSIDHSLYLPLACMHVLRSTYLPAYDSLIRPPYTSDPFPLSLPGSSHTTATPTSPTTPSSPSFSSQPQSQTQTPLLQRETQVLDFFIALKVREDVWADDSELHLEREESFKDLFDLMQPRSRVEDLVRYYGVREGLIYVGGGGGPASTPTPIITPTSQSQSQSRQRTSRSQKPQPQPLPFSSLSISFSPRTVGLLLSTSTAHRKRTIVQVSRTREEKLEYTAKRLVRELGAWLAAGNTAGGRR